MNLTPAICRPFLVYTLLPFCLAALLPAPSHAAPTHELIRGLDYPPKNPSIGTLVPSGVGDGYYWGTSVFGGAYNLGSVYKVKGDGSDWQVIATFSGVSGSTKGSLPFFGLMSDGAGNMWGTTYQGGTSDAGTVFKINVSTGALTTLVEFTGTSGANKGSNPVGRLTSDGAGNLWGSTTAGGANGKGTIFQINASTGVLTTVIEFTGTSGANKGDQPYAGLENDGAGYFWGSTNAGGASNKGTLFKLEISTGTLTTLVELTGNTGANKGASPIGRMVSDGAGFFWGTCSAGGVNNFGTIYKLEASTGVMTTLIEFTNSAGAYGKIPYSELASDGQGNFWGTTYQGGSVVSRGTIYKINMTTGALTTVLEFTDLGGASEGWQAYAGLVSDGAGSFIGTTYQGGPVGHGNVYKINISTSAYTVLTGFHEKGFTLNSGVASAADGTLWGTTLLGGSGGLGTIYKVNPATGALTTVVEFTGTSGANLGMTPSVSLVSDGAGSFWGVTNQGGTNGQGTVFKVNATTGALTTVVNFTGSSGANLGSSPAGQLYNDGAGFMWGTTAGGGQGTIFKVDISTGAFTNVLNFAFNTPPKGSAPRAGLVSDGAGNLWGTTTSGGGSAKGTVFKIDMSTGNLTTLVEFTGTTGSYPGQYPAAGLASDGAGYMWGSTRFGGTSNFGTVFKVNIATGAHTTVVEFTNSAGALGKAPFTGLTSDGAGNMWGATNDESTTTYGTVFKVNTTTNTLTTVLQFTAPGFQANSGPGPLNGYLLKGTDGNFYGTTASASPGGGGSIFRVRLGPTPATLAATSVGTSSATLNGTVNPNGTASTAYCEYGTSQGSLTSSTATENLSSGTSATSVAHNVTGLNPGTTYYYRVCGENTDQLQPQVGDVMSFTTLPSSNADLADLDIGAGTLTPDFDAGVISYTATVSNATTSITVTPTVAQGSAAVTVNGNTVTSGSASGAISLNPGNNVITTVVTAQDNTTTKTYTVTVTRLSAEIAVEQPAGNGLTDGSVTPVAFGNAVVGNNVDLVFTIKNVGEGNLTGLTITKDGADEAMFTVTANPTAPVSGPSGSTTFTMRFTPASAGTKVAALHIANNDADESPFDIELTGTGVAPQFGVIAFQDAQVFVNEAAVIINVPLVRSGGSDGAVSVRVDSAIGSATLADYNVVNNVLVSFGNGETSKTVPVTIRNDALIEGNETFTLALSDAQGGAGLGGQQVVTIRILEPDTTVPAISVTAPGATANAITGGTVDVTGIATDNKGVNQVKVSLNGGAFTDAALTPAGSTSPLSTMYTLAVTPKTGANTVSVKSIDHRNNTSTTVTRTFTVWRPLAVLFAGTGTGTVTKGFAPSSPREVGKSFTITATPTVPLTPTITNPGSVFTGWTVGNLPGLDQAQTLAKIGVTASSLEKTSLTFIFREELVLTAEFAANPFPALAGTYNGLIQADEDNPDRLPAGQGTEDGTPPGNSTQGLFSATLTATGAFSAKLTIDGLVLKLMGLFDASGSARFGTARAFTLAVPRPNKPSLFVAFSLRGDQISGTVTAKDFKQSVVTALSNFLAERAYYTGLTGPLTVPDDYLTVTGTAPSPTGRTDGVFTVIFPSIPVASQPARIQNAGFTTQDYPQGTGVGTIKITKGGVVTLTGTLADGTAVSAASTLSENLSVALFSQIYTAKGFISAQVQLDSSEPDSDLQPGMGPGMLWSRPFLNTSHHYPYGWPEVIKVDMMGARYVATTGQSVVKAANGTDIQAADEDGNVTLTYSDGQLSEPIEKFANLSTNDIVSNVPDNDPTFTMKINRLTGAVTGTFRHTNDTLPGFSAMIFQKGPSAGAYGYFLTKQPVPVDYTGESGAVSLIGQRPDA